MRAAAILALALITAAAFAAKRSPVAVAAFKREHPCPATGQTRGACPGWIVDHIEPLCAGGADEPRNMQWQTVEAAKAKDREEWSRCRTLRVSRP